MANIRKRLKRKAWLYVALHSPRPVLEVAFLRNSNCGQSHAVIKI